MKSPLIAMPCSLLTALLISSLLLDCLQLPVVSTWLLAATGFFALLLWQRNLIELTLIAVITVITQISFEPGGDSRVSADVLLALLIALVTLPAILGLMGVMAPSIGERESAGGRRA